LEPSSSIIEASTITGGSGNDLLFGQAGADTLFGKGGYDLLFGGDGKDVLTERLVASICTGSELCSLGPDIRLAQRP
jgi:hypothetical protein